MMLVIDINISVFICIKYFYFFLNSYKLLRAIFLHYSFKINISCYNNKISFFFDHSTTHFLNFTAVATNLN